ncbi:putative disease resistance protein [Hibiscus syriacus]|uniref:Disease resistance protein n=1 Tax=Hibiscus syriacus TaxID=106335 RepID=A0A6A2ZXB1_HIBSY|nr:putative disease resistance protein [Hibiscus syriacus]
MVDLMVDPEDVSPNASSLSPGTSQRMFGIQHIPKHDTVKLTESTYLLWKHQVALIIDGYGLLRFISVGYVAPDEFITNASGQLEENPVFAAHRQQDKLLASWLLTTVSTEVLPHLTGLTTAMSIWNTISRLFGARSSAKISSLRHNLHSQRKTGLTIREYLAKVKSICDLLNASGSVVTEQEHVNVVLVGLTMEFESIIAIASRENFSLDILTEMLLDCEARQKMFLSENFSVNLVLQSREGAAVETDSCGTQDVNTGSSQDHSSRGQSNGYRGRGRGRNNNRPQCQLCGRFGHVVQKCYHRFDRDYTGVSGSESMQENGSKPTGAGNSAKHQQSGGQTYAHTVTSMPPPSSFVPTPFYFPSPYAPVHYPFPGTSPGFPPDASRFSHGASHSSLTLGSAAYIATVPTPSGSSSSVSVDSLWYPDTGATHHVTNDLSVFQSGTTYTGGSSLLMGNGEGISIMHVGQGFLSSSKKPLILQNMLHVPNIKKKLLSVSQFTRDNGVFMEFHPSECLVKDARTQATLLRGRLTGDGLYQLLPCEDQRSSCLVNNVSKSPVSLKLWHQRLGHPSLDIVQHVLKSCSLVFNKTEAVNVCSACMQGKSHKLPFCKSFTQYNEPFQLVFSDVWGPAPVCSTEGFLYYVSFVDVCSRYTWMYLLKRKSEVTQCFLDFAKLVEVQFGYKIKALQTDGGGEYQPLRKWFSANGVQHRLSCPGTSEQNGKAEMKHRHIVETGLTILPTPVLHGKSPFEALHHVLPDYSFLRVFGCACYPCLRLFNRHKLDFRSKKCVFLGYSTAHKGYKCVAPDNGVSTGIIPLVSPVQTLQVPSTCVPPVPAPSTCVPPVPAPSTHLPPCASPSTHDSSNSQRHNVYGATPFEMVENQVLDERDFGNANEGIFVGSGAHGAIAFENAHGSTLLSRDNAHAPTAPPTHVTPTSLSESSPCASPLTSMRGPPLNSTHGPLNSTFAHFHTISPRAALHVPFSTVSTCAPLGDNVSRVIDSTPGAPPNGFLIANTPVMRARPPLSKNNPCDASSTHSTDEFLNSPCAAPLFSTLGTTPFAEMPNVEGQGLDNVHVRATCDNTHGATPNYNIVGTGTHNPRNNIIGDISFAHDDDSHGTVLFDNAPLDHDVAHGVTSFGAMADRDNVRGASSTGDSAHEPVLVQNIHPMVTRAKDGIRKPRVLHVECLDEEPRSIREAMKIPHWKKAAQEEFDALIANKTSSLVSLPKDRVPVNCKWIFKVKRNADGSVSRYKSRLVAKGFLQQPGIDYHEVFSPVVKPVTVRVILTLALTRGWLLRQVDINNAFLNGALMEEVYMTQPPGFVQAGGSLVCKLHKAIYGLKQAPRAWFERLREYLVSERFGLSKSNSSLFVRKSENSVVYMLVYVDYIILTGSDASEVQCVIEKLNTRFALKDLGSLNFFLGIEVCHDADGVVLTQQKYIHELLHKHGFNEAKSLPTPMVSNCKLSADAGEPVEDMAQYRSIVGALQYIVVTRPDIAFAVNKVCQFMQSPRNSHFQAVKRILRYLQGTTDYGLRFTASSRMSLTGFADADWGSDPDDRRSTTGYCIFFGGNLISWSSRKQQVVSRSTAEAEYRSVASAAAEIVWIESLLQELCMVPHGKATLWCDNSSTVAVCANPVQHSKFKHVELDLFFVREMVADGRLQVNEVPAYEQVADVLTKPLSSASFLKHRQKLLVTQLRGLPAGLQSGMTGGILKSRSAEEIVKLLSYHCSPSCHVVIRKRVPCTSRCKCGSKRRQLKVENGRRVPVSFDRIASTMIFAGYEVECCIAYSGLRLKALDAELSKLSFENINVDDAERMSWKSLEVEIDIYEALRDLNNMEIGNYLSAKEFVSETSMVQGRIGETAVSIFSQLENSIESDNAGRIPVAGGAVHPLTRYTMNYLKYACEYKDTLEQAFRKHNETEELTVEKVPENYIKKDDRCLQASPFALKFMKVMDLLDANIEMKSKLYRSPSLRYIFLMSNGRYILQKIKESTDIYEMLGHSWSRKRTSELRRYHKLYQRETWSNVLQTISHEGVQVNGKVSRTILKERFKNFNALFDEILKTQSTWVVSDGQIKSELRVSISSVMIPAYRSFVGRFQSYFDNSKQAGKYIRYQPEDIEELIEQLFEGNTTSMVKR